MKNLRNRVQLIGNLGADPEIKSFENNKLVANLSIATSESFTNSDGDKIDNTQWHNVVAWGKNADLAGKYLSKGNQVCIEG